MMAPLWPMWGFNSSMVRLGVTLKHLRVEVIPCFNSSMVRLGGLTDDNIDTAY